MRIRSLSLKLALMAIGTIAAVFLTGLVVLVGQVATTIKAQTDELQTQTTNVVAAQVSAELDRASEVAKGMVAALTGLRSNGATDRSAYDAILRTTVEQNPQLVGTWAGFEPDALDGNDRAFANGPGSDATGRYIPYFNRGSGEVVLEALVGYDQPGAGDYYQLPKSLGRAVAIEPYAYSVAGKEMLLTTIGVPVIVDGRFLGAAGVDLALGDLSTRIAEQRPFGDGSVELLTANGVVVGSRDAASVGTTVAADSPVARAAQAALAGTASSQDATDARGVLIRHVAVPIKVGVTDDRWVVVTSVPVATLDATVNEAAMLISALAILCMIITGAILFLVIRRVVGRPLGMLGKTVSVMAEGNYAVEVPGQDRVDEVGTLSRAVEVFRQNGLKVAEMTEAEAARIIRAQEARAA